jgi:hypothetical protein
MKRKRKLMSGKWFAHLTSSWCSCRDVTIVLRVRRCCQGWALVNWANCRLGLIRRALNNGLRKAVTDLTTGRQTPPLGCSARPALVNSTISRASAMGYMTVERSVCFVWRSKSIVDPDRSYLVSKKSVSRRWARMITIEVVSGKLGAG